MTESGKTWQLIFGVTLMGLTAWSAFAAGAETGTPACAAKVKGEVAMLEAKNGRHPSNNAQNNLLVKCSEAEVGVQLEGLFANHDQEAASDKEARCQTSVKFAIDNGIETSGLSKDELVSRCMELPSEASAVCGFPADPDSYFVLENQSCVKKTAGLASHDVVAKVDAMAKPGDGEASGDGGTTDDGNPPTDGEPPVGATAQ